MIKLGNNYAKKTLVNKQSITLNKHTIGEMNPFSMLGCLN